MKRLASSAICGLLFSAACGNPPAPARRTATPATAAKPVAEDEVKPVLPASIYVYSPIGKRDPFQNMGVATAGVSRQIPSTAAGPSGWATSSARTAAR